MTAPHIPERPTLRELVELNQHSEVLQTDTGNAHRFTQMFRDRVRYEPESRMWYVWTDTHWEPDIDGLAFALTESVIARMREEALTMSDEAPNGGVSPRERMLLFALKTESEGARRRMLSVAESNPRIIVRADEMNCVNNFIACPNGTINLDTGELIPSIPQHMSTACVRVAYDPNARSEELDRYLETFMPDEEDQSVIFGVLGTAMRGGNATRLMPLFLGSTTSGKSQLIAAVANLLRGYAVSINVSVFRGNLDDKPRPDLVRVMHTRVAYANEAAQSWELHADQVKRLTGGEKMSFRNLYAQHVEAEPQFTPLIVANEMPRVKGADDALRRRMLVVRFNRPLSTQREDTRVKQRFINDPVCLQALLARLVVGARSTAFVNGVRWEDLSSRFALATMDAFDEVDHVGAFLLWMIEQAHLVSVGSSASAFSCAKASDLHGWYVRWVKRHGDRIDREGQLNQRDFGRSLRTRGWESTVSSGVRWLGYQLRSNVDWL